MIWMDGYRAKSEPLTTGARYFYRRKSNMTNNLTITLHNKREGEIAILSQIIDNMRLSTIAHSNR